MLLLEIKRASSGDHNCNLLIMLIREQSKPVLQHFCCLLFNGKLFKTWILNPILTSLLREHRMKWSSTWQHTAAHEKWLYSDHLGLAPRFQEPFYPKHKRMSLHKSLACSETVNQRISPRHSFSFSKVYPSPSLSSLPHSMTFLSFKSSRIHRNESHPWSQNVHLYLYAYVFV